MAARRWAAASSNSLLNSAIFFAGRGNPPLGGQHVFVLAPFPVLHGVAQAFLSNLEHGVRPFRKLDRLRGQLQVQLPLFLGDFFELDFFGRNTAQLVHQAQLVQQPDAPFGRGRTARVSRHCGNRAEIRG